ncbi:3-hydroxyacyl-CoA dehydrogenase family protein [Photobacterium leiognathi]|uniref:L-gulonate 3-dehydrogenase n=1 Tax=Photobacterium leiognathi TaxID=553611 RepID=A0A2T3M485_PHOLE|nr:3-hydroxyacyl-CoA dehydrogenase family protein [Photobacterium leiognathi]KJF89428.1 hypothetical protein UB42_13220 [Photobacterium leiognathi]PSV75279.1 3-hydroxyacyl-CoA dehydrogenase family protein [Photobacterium leiognathi]PSV86704.1 3-hydroxyacyl-CoA dehydrogenase family protein [Photobacterium leiognathi]
MSTGKIEQISVVGAGILGHSIAQRFASEGFNVNLYDSSKVNLLKAKNNIFNNLISLSKSNLLKSTPTSIFKKINFFEGLSRAVADSNLVIEAVTEDLELKKIVLQQIESAVCDECIIASNSSSIIPSEYNSELKIKSRVLGTHFFNPPHLLPLVELIYSHCTSNYVKSEMESLFTNMGMHPIVVYKESPGFIGNRLQFALLKEAISIVQEGISTPQDIDIVVKYGFGRRLSIMGPFEVFDYGGWDTIEAVYPNIIGDPVPQEILEKVSQGKLGVKTGEGFYKWDPINLNKKQKLINDVYTYLEKKVSKQ